MSRRAMGEEKWLPGTHWKVAVIWWVLRVWMIERVLVPMVAKVLTGEWGSFVPRRKMARPVLSGRVWVLSQGRKWSYQNDPEMDAMLWKVSQMIHCQRAKRPDSEMPMSVRSGLGAI